jgi:hypothetical protein
MGCSFTWRCPTESALLQRIDIEILVIENTLVLNAFALLSKKKSPVLNASFPREYIYIEEAYSLCCIFNPLQW